MVPLPKFRYESAANLVKKGGEGKSQNEWQKKSAFCAFSLLNENWNHTGSGEGGSGFLFAYSEGRVQRKSEG